MPSLLIVHAIKPEFLDGAVPALFAAEGHFFPALVSLGYLHGTALGIRGGYAVRNYRVKIVEDLEARFSGRAFGVAATSLLD
ncbi:MAG: hypothetical protein ABI401_03615 [Candidatus Dormibacter sp.]